MIRQDYLLVIIEQFFQAITKLLHKKEENPDYLSLEIDKIYTRFLNSNRTFFLSAQMSDIYRVFQQSKYELAQAEMLAELFYRELQLFNPSQKNAEIAAKLIELYDYIDVNSQTYSLDRSNRRKEVEAYL